MALKKLIDKDTFEKMSADMQTEYKLGDDGKYHLDLEDDDAAALKRAKDHEKAARLAAEAKLKEREDADAAAAAKVAEAELKAAKAAGDTEALEKSWKKKHEDDVAAAKAEGKAAQAALKGLFVNKVAREMAEAISTVPDLLVDKIKARLDLEIHEGEPITRVLTLDGKPSALSLDDLRKEFVDNKSYAAIIKASDAQGGGAGAGNDGNGVPSKKLSEMTATEEAQFANKHPEQYKRMLNG